MKCIYCERGMWRIIAPVSLRFLPEQEWNVSMLKKAKTVYRQMVARVPGIGGLTGSFPHICLVAGMIWLPIDWMGRPQALAAGGDCCDFYSCKKDSKWDQDRGKIEQ